MEATALGLPLMIDAQDEAGNVFSPISTLVVSKGMDSEGRTVYALALSEGMDIVDALALAQYAIIDINNRVEQIVTS